MDKFKLSLTGVFGFMIIAIILNQSPLFWLFFIASLACIPLSFSIAKKDVNDQKQKLTKIFNSTIENNSLSPSQQFLSSDLTNGIALDEEQGKIVLLYKEKDSDSFSIYRFRFDKIIEIEVNQDGDTVTKVSKGGLLGGALVGGVLAGGIGSVIGSLAANKSSTEKVKNINMRIILNELSTPTFTINFLNSLNPISKDSEQFKTIVKDVDHWYGIFTILLKRNNEKNIANR